MSWICSRREVLDVSAPHGKMNWRRTAAYSVRYQRPHARIAACEFCLPIPPVQPDRRQFVRAYIQRCVSRYESAPYARCCVSQRNQHARGRGDTWGSGGEVADARLGYVAEENCWMSTGHAEGRAGRRTACIRLTSSAGSEPIHKVGTSARYARCCI